MAVRVRVTVPDAEAVIDLFVTVRVGLGGRLGLLNVGVAVILSTSVHVIDVDFPSFDCDDDADADDEIDAVRDLFE